jgi:4-hydroxybenzoate polyprenyltransferase
LSFRQLKTILEMIKFEHTIFALPFAIMSAFLAAETLPSWSKLGWILVAMVGARSCAMSFNRLADAEIDTQNPRTKRRAIPAGLLRKSEVWVFTIFSSLLLVVAAYQLNPLAFKLSPVALATVMLYSYTKRFTSMSHLWLGLSLSIAPIGAWIAIKGQFDVLPLLLGLAVMLWTAGFDIIYACQDLDFDRRRGLYSIPAQFGIYAALWISMALHVITVILLVVIWHVSPLGLIYLVGVGLVSAILIYEHAIVKPHDLSRVNLAFFTLNGAVSLILMFLTVADVLMATWSML